MSPPRRYLGVIWRGFRSAWRSRLRPFLWGFWWWFWGTSGKK